MKEGDRVRFVHTSDRYSDLKPGEEGTVAFVDNLGTIHVDWDNGSGLGLVPGHDQWINLGGGDD